MTKEKWSFLICMLMLGLAVMACNLSAAVSGSAPPISATLTPLPTSEFSQEESFPGSEFFVEEFSQGMPDNWLAAAEWSARDGSLATSSAGSEQKIPGEWLDLSLFARLRFESDGFAVLFNQSEAGAYKLLFSREGVSLVWQPAVGDPESLAAAQVEIDQAWHDLVLRQAHGNLEVMLDGQLLLKEVKLGLSPAGSIGLVNLSAGKLEFDRIVLAPPGLGLE